MRKLVLLTFLMGVLLHPDISAQKRKKSKPSSEYPASTSADARMEGFNKRKELSSKSLVKNVPFKNVGPTVMSGRVTDIDANTEDPSIFYVAYASGGLWKTESNGSSFFPIFDNEMTMSIGDIAVDWKNKETLWVGTGENNSSRSSYSGSGMYKSEDQGKTWKHLGLEDSHHIGRIIIHPESPQTVWVASAGHLYSPNSERGVYKTTDGGETWNKTLFINDSTGIIDLIIDPSDANILYAAAWEKDRKAWNFKESGVSSGIYKSTDGGENWTLITGGDSGFPQTSGTGRIGLDISVSNPQIVYAILDNQDFRDKEEEDEEEGLTKEQLRTMSSSEFLDLGDKDVESYLRDYGFPRKYKASSVKEMVRSGEITPLALVEYVEDANRLLFDTPVKGAEMYRSDDGGKTWRKTHDDYIDNLVYTYGYYFGQVRVSSTNPDHVYTMGVPLIKSDDGGETWKSISRENVHSDHHALWLNPSREGHIINGNDGGINISYDDGKTYYKCNSPQVGQFYSVMVDMSDTYNIYGGLQDNGVWFGPHDYEESYRWQSSGRYPYRSIMGGDGMMVAVDTRDNETVYTGFQFGNYFRVNTHTGERKRITPQHELGERPYRWNWESPIINSKHNQDVVYFGSNHFHRSLDKGENFDKLSGDLTRGGKKGDVPYGTLTTLSESPMKFGLIYVGSDDGYIHLSQDGGYNWSRVSDNLPQWFWISQIDASNHQEGRVYASLNGYRWDNFEAHVYVSDNYGSTWRRIGTDLPQEPVNVVKEDPVNEDIIYVGTDHGVYVSLDRGASFMAMEGELPAVPVHDLLVHPRENHLVLGTHGRSFYVADVSTIQQMNSELMAKTTHLFQPDVVNYNSRWGASFGWREPFEPEVSMTYYANAAGSASFQVKTKEGDVVKEWTQDADKGLNMVGYDLSFEESAKSKIESEDKKVEKANNGKFYLLPGKYDVTVTMAGQSSSTTLEVKERRGR